MIFYFNDPGSNKDDHEAFDSTNPQDVAWSMLFPQPRAGPRHQRKIADAPSGQEVPDPLLTPSVSDGAVSYPGE